MKHPRQAYEWLTKNNVHWDRKDSSHIVVWTSGYKTMLCQTIERSLMTAGMRCVVREFDKHCGKTYSVYKHQ